MSILARKPMPERDRIVICQEDGTADIATIFDADDQAIYASSPASDYAIPKGDIRNVYVGPNGRIYTLFASSDYVADTVRLAALEQSIVLRQITHFAKPPLDEKEGLNIQKIMLYLLIGVLLLAVIFK